MELAILPRNLLIPRVACSWFNSKIGCKELFNHRDCNKLVWFVHMCAVCIVLKEMKEERTHSYIKCKENRSREKSGAEEAPAPLSPDPTLCN